MAAKDCHRGCYVGSDRGFKGLSWTKDEDSNQAVAVLVFGGCVFPQVQAWSYVY